MIIDFAANPTQSPHQSNQFDNNHSTYTTKQQQPPLYSLFGGGHPLAIDLHEILSISSKATSETIGTSVSSNSNLNSSSRAHVALANGVVLPPPGFSNKATMPPKEVDEEKHTAVSKEVEQRLRTLSIALPSSTNHSRTSSITFDSDESYSPSSAGSSNSSSTVSSQSSSRKGSFSMGRSSPFTIRMIDEPVATQISPAAPIISSYPSNNPTPLSIRQLTHTTPVTQPSTSYLTSSNYSRPNKRSNPQRSGRRNH